MSALHTETIDDKPQILLVGDRNSLTKDLVHELSLVSGISSKLVGWDDLDEDKTDLAKIDWYKVVYFFQPDRELKSEELRSLLSSKLRQSIFILPLSNFVSGEEVSSWNNQVEKEEKTFKLLSPHFNQARVVFYRELLDKNIYPARIFFEKLERKILQDPLVELSLLDHDLLVKSLVREILTVNASPLTLINGKSRLSKLILEKLQHLYQQYHQFKLPIRQLGLRLTTHPVLMSLNQEPVEKIIESSLEDLVEKLARDLPRLSADEVIEKPVEKLSNPVKEKLLSQWNQTEAKLKKTSLSEDSSQIQSPLMDVESGSGSVGVKPSVRKPVKPPTQEVNSLFNAYRHQQKKDHLVNLTSQTKKGFRKLRNSRFLFSGGVLFSFLAALILVYFGIFFWRVNQVKARLVDYLVHTNQEILRQDKLESLEKSVQRVDGRLEFISQFSADIFTNAVQAVEMGQLLVDLENSQQKNQEKMGLAYRQFFAQDQGVSFQTLDEANQDVATAFRQLSLLTAELKSYPRDGFSPEEKQVLDNFEKVLSDQENELIQYQQLSPLFSQLLAQDERKVYAIVLQNNQELRPTGGFIQAVALLTVENGQLINTQVDDVYAFDQDLKGDTSPPAEITQLLGEERWYLRDANWDPDFAKSSRQIAEFIDNSVGVEVAGVIGINLNTLQEILDVVEKLELPEQNETLTSRNLEERMEFHSEIELAENSGQRDYSELLLDRLLAKLSQLSGQEGAEIMSVVVAAANKQELQFALTDRQLQATIASLGWSGELTPPSCPSVFKGADCVVDSIAQVEANVGVNKANYYLERQIDHSIEVLPNQIKHKRVVSFENKASNNVWPKGPYQAYTRFYLPKEVENIRVLINQEELSTESYTVATASANLILGMTSSTPVGQQTEIQLEYTLPHEENTPFAYAFFDRKQPGAREFSPRIFLKHSADYSPTLIAPQAEVQGDVIVFSPTRETGHTFVGAEFE